MKKIKLDNKNFFYSIEAVYRYDEFQDSMFSHYETVLYDGNVITEQVTKKRIVKYGFLKLFGNKYETYTENVDKHTRIGSLPFNIETTKKHTKEECINQLIGLLPKDYNDLTW